MINTISNGESTASFFSNEHSIAPQLSSVALNSRTFIASLSSSINQSELVASSENISNYITPTMPLIINPSTISQDVNNNYPLVVNSSQITPNSTTVEYTPAPSENSTKTFFSTSVNVFIQTSTQSLVSGINSTVIFTSNRALTTSLVSPNSSLINIEILTNSTIQSKLLLSNQSSTPSITLGTESSSSIENPISNISAPLPALISRNESLVINSTSISEEMLPSIQNKQRKRRDVDKVQTSSPQIINTSVAIISSTTASSIEPSESAIFSKISSSLDVLPIMNNKVQPSSSLNLTATTNMPSTKIVQSSLTPDVSQNVSKTFASSFNSMVDPSDISIIQPSSASLTAALRNPLSTPSVLKSNTTTLTFELNKTPSVTPTSSMLNSTMSFGVLTKVGSSAVISPKLHYSSSSSLLNQSDASVKQSISSTVSSLQIATSIDSLESSQQSSFIFVSKSKTITTIQYCTRSIIISACFGESTVIIKNSSQTTIGNHFTICMVQR